MKKIICFVSILSLTFMLSSCASAPKAWLTDEELCEKKNYQKCHDLGMNSFNEKDFCKAADFYEKACNGGFMESCTLLGDSHANGDCGKQDNCKAVGFYEKACNGGNMLGCSYLGDSYENGWCVTKDLDRAMELYKRACEEGGVNCKKLR